MNTKTRGMAVTSASYSIYVLDITANPRDISTHTAFAPPSRRVDCARHHHLYMVGKNVRSRLSENTACNTGTDTRDVFFEQQHYTVCGMDGERNARDGLAVPGLDLSCMPYAMGQSSSVNSLPLAIDDTRACQLSTGQHRCLPPCGCWYFVFEREDFISSMLDARSQRGCQQRRDEGHAVSGI